MNLKYAMIFFSVFLCMVLDNNVFGDGQKASIKIIYEMNSEAKSFLDSIEGSSKSVNLDKKLENHGLKLDNAFNKAEEKSRLAKDDSYLAETTKSFKASEALDTKRITLELQEALVDGFAKKGFTVSNDNVDYIVSFVVNEVTYDDFKGECYIRSLSYKLFKDSKIIYQGIFVPEKKRTWFGGGQYSHLVRTSVIANKIVKELSASIQ